MLKHVQLSPYRNRAADTLSLSSRSGDSSSPDSMSLTSRIPPLDSRTSPEGCSARRDRTSDTLSISSHSPDPLSSSLSSRSSSCCSLADANSPSTTIKVYCKCLRSDIEYKTLRITFQTTCREVVSSLLNKFRMRHRDPNLFYLTMEVTLRKAGLRTVLALDEDTRPAALQACHPKGDSRLALQTRRGGLVKIYDNVLMPGSQYKSLLISEKTTVDELIQILLNCYSSNERVEQFSLYEVCEDQEFQRKLHPDDCPLQVQYSWLPDMHLHFLIRRNPDYRRNNKMRILQNSWTPDPPCTPYVSKRSMQITSLLDSRPSLLNTRSSFVEARSSAGSSSRDDSRLSCYSDYDNYFYI